MDVEVDGRPRGSYDVADGDCELVVPGVPGARSVRLEGFFEGTLVAAHRAGLMRPARNRRSTARPSPAPLEPVPSCVTRSGTSAAARASRP